MADPVSICQSIVSFVVKVRGMLATFHSNEKDCERILRVVKITEAVVEPLQRLPDVVRKKQMSEALAGLNGALQEASEVVRKCQKKSKALGVLESDAISKDLLQVYDEIFRYVKLVDLAIGIDTRLMLTKAPKKQAAHHRTSVAHPDFQQANRSSTEYRSHQIEPKMGTKKTGVAGRSEEKNEKGKAPAVGIKAPWASSSDGSAKSTPEKSVIGQDGPFIANKDSSYRSNPGNGAGSSKKKSKIKERCGPNTTGSKNKTEKTNVSVSADSKGSRASHSNAKSTSGRSVDGQGHPRIVTKMVSTRSMTGVTSIDVHPAEPWIVTGDREGNICIWNYKTQETVMKKLVTKERTTIKEKTAKHWVCSAKFIPKKNWLVVGDGRGYIHVYDYTNTKLPEVKNIKSPDGNPVDLLAVHPTKTCLLSSSASGNKIILWDWSGDDWKNNHEFDIESTCPDGVLSLEFNPRHSNTFACVTNNKRLMVGNIKFHSLTTKQKGLSRAGYFFDRADQCLMVTLSISSHEAEIQNLETGKVVAPLRVSGRRTRLIAGHPTLPIVVTALDDGTVCFWDSSTYRLEKKVKHVTDEPADDLTLVTNANGITRLAVTSESMIAIMEVSYSPTASTSRPTSGGDDG